MTPDLENADRPVSQDETITRRTLVATAATAIGAAVVAGIPALANEQASQKPLGPASSPEDPTRVPGAPTSAVGARSPFAERTRWPSGDITGSSLTPLQDLAGTITPADLHFERHHA